MNHPGPLAEVKPRIRLYFAILVCSIAAACSSDDGDNAPIAGNDSPSEYPNVEVAKDITYALEEVDDPESRELDVYSPIESGNWPVAVILHGGSGSRRTPSIVEFSNRLADQGVVVFAASYAPATPVTLVADDGRAMREVLETVICAISYAKIHAEDFGGDSSRLTVIGQSAGGFFGCLASFLGEEMAAVWEGFEESRGGPPNQIACVEYLADVGVHGFVGFNGSYFIFEGIDLLENDPELRDLVNVENYIGKNSSLVVRFITGSNDVTQPEWHLTRSDQFIESLQAAEYDAEADVVEAGHDFNFTGSAWDETIRIVLEVLYPAG